MNKRNENKKGYKKTKVGWIPEEWECLAFKSFAKLTAGGTPSTRHPEYWNGSIPWMSSGELNFKRVFTVEGCITKKGLKNSSTKIIPKHSVLVGLAGQGKTRGTVAINEIDLCTNQSVAAILPNITKANYLYLFFHLDNRYEELRRLSTGDGGRGGLNLGILGTLKIPLPPLPEQKKIAEILSAWDSAIEQMGKLINAKTKLKKVLMQQILTGKRRFKEFGKPARGKGRFPDGWETKPLGSFGSFLKGKGITNSEKKETGFPCITYGEIYTKYNFILKEFHSFIDAETARTSQRIKNNDILFAGSGETLDEIGKCVACTKDIEAYAGGDIVIFRPDNGNSIYLSYVLNSDFITRYRRKLGQGHSVVDIYSSGLKTLQIPLPSLPEQKEFAKILSDCDREVEFLNKKREKFQEQKKGLMQKLLTGQIRVKV